jgi:HSP20 family molecular chaperone IbpA
MPVPRHHSSAKGAPAIPTALPKAPVDVVETVVAHVFFIDVPGLKKDDVIVKVEDPPEKRILSISGTRPT